MTRVRDVSYCNKVCIIEVILVRMRKFIPRSFHTIPLPALGFSNVVICSISDENSLKRKEIFTKRKCVDPGAHVFRENMTTENAQIQGHALNGVTEDEDVVTPWIVTSTNDSGIDYDKLISKFHFARCILLLNNYSCKIYEENVKIKLIFRIFHDFPSP